MIDEEVNATGRINWPVVIVASVAIHAVVLGAFWYFSGSQPSEDVEEPAPVASGDASGREDGSSSDEGQTPDTPHDAPRTTHSAPRTDSTNPPPGTNTVYVVKSGDNLSRIAAAHGCTADQLAELNGLTGAAKNNLRLGQKLKLPAGRP